MDNLGRIRSLYYLYEDCKEIISVFPFHTGIGNCSKQVTTHPSLIPQPLHHSAADLAMVVKGIRQIPRDMVFEAFFTGLDERGLPCPLNDLWQFFLKAIAKTDPAHVFAGVNVSLGIDRVPSLTE